MFLPTKRHGSHLGPMAMVLFSLLAAHGHPVNAQSCSMECQAPPPPSSPGGGVPDDSASAASPGAASAGAPSPPSPIEVEARTAFLRASSGLLERSDSERAAPRCLLRNGRSRRRTWSTFGEARRALMSSISS
jgi:hypothetical protein